MRLKNENPLPHHVMSQMASCILIRKSLIIIIIPPIVHTSVEKKMRVNFNFVECDNVHISEPEMYLSCLLSDQT